MTRSAETIVKRIAVLAAVVGFGSSIAFLLVACGGTSAAPRAASLSPWQPLPAAPVKIDADLTSVWTGSRLILFGRHTVTKKGPGGAPYAVKSFNTAESYDPASKTWTRLSPPHGPGYVPDYDAVWTGKELLAFSAFGSFAYDPEASAWRTLRKSVGGGIVVWTGREAIGWGGGCCGDAWGNGSAYDPVADTYRNLAPSPLAPNQSPVGAWTGRELVLFSSGFDPGSGKPYPASFARAAAYDPATDSWRRLARPPRFGGGAAWDGHEVLVAGAGSSARLAYAFDPAANRWRRLAAMPFGLQGATAFWTGRRLLVWGDAETGRGLAYNPRTGRWSVLPAAPLRGTASAVAWTGHRLLVLSGVRGAAFTPTHP